MSHEERNTYAGILTGVLFIAVYLWLMRGMVAGGIPEGTEALTVWARMILKLIGAGIVAAIAITILINILHAIFTKDGSPSFLVDERDRAIAIWGMRVTLAVISIVFIGGLVTLALGWQPFVTLNIMFLGFSAGSMSGDLARAFLYRRGA